MRCADGGAFAEEGDREEGVKHFKRVHSDRYMGLKVRPLAFSLSLSPSLAGLLFQKRANF